MAQVIVYLFICFYNYIENTGLDNLEHLR